jgi:hypothetical protein
VYVVTTVCMVTVKLLRDFCRYRIVFMVACVYHLDIAVIIDGRFSSEFIINIRSTGVR